jgi:putative endonuclease
MIKNWIVYILQCSDDTYYTGITNNLKKRIKNHNLGKAARYTSQRLPIKLRYSKDGYSQGEARKAEMIMKNWKREKKEKLINGKISQLNLK